MPDAKPQGIANRIGSFFLTVVKSCYDMEWYRVVRSRPWTKALAYAALFQSALTLFVVASLASHLFGAETAFVAHVLRTFPDGAALTVKSGHLSTNLPEPFEAGSKWLRVVFDTSFEGLEPAARYKDFDGVVVGRDAIFFPRPHYTSSPSIVTQQRVYRMADFSEFSVTKAQLIDWLQAWGGLFILGLLVLFAVTYLGIMIVTTVGFVALASAVAYGLGRLWGIRTGYAAWFAVGLHAATLPLLVNYATTAADIRIPFAFTFIYFMFVAAVIADERSQPVLSAEPPAPPAPPAQPEPSEPKPPRPPRKIAARKPRPPKPPEGPVAGE
ncbi:MAG TPA: DUF1189 family protein [Patescibacteria group bacterium]|nr:DUF1189 family protein [Patescibacteria group bacterium]